jgi:tRNA(Arg) A34 adenosine deaminase TadA
MSAKTGPTREQQDAHFMECALRQAEVAVTNGQTPFGAVVVDRGGVLVGEGYNTVRSALDPRSP